MHYNDSDTQIVFDDNELEIALVTANRSNYVDEWLLKCLKDIKKRNIRLSIYDSSDLDETKRIIEERALLYNYQIDYYRIDPKTTIGYKPILPIKNTSCKYLWVSGDSRYHDMDILDRSVFKTIKEGMIDYIVFHIDNNDENDGKVYTDKSELLRECFLSMTCIGLSIYKTRMFKNFFKDNKLIEKVEEKYANNYAFAWIGYFLEAYARYGNTSKFFCVPIINILAQKKVQSWYKRFYGCWGQDLCDLMDGVGTLYNNTDKIIKETWLFMNIDMAKHVYNTKMRGDLSPQLYEKFQNSGIWSKITDNSEMYQDFAYAEGGNIAVVRDKWIEKEKALFKTKFQRIIESKIGLLMDYNVCIYGAGVGGEIVKTILEEEGVRIQCFYDINASVCSSIGGYCVKEPSEIKPTDYIIVSFINYRSIKKRLIDLGVTNNNILYLKELIWCM